MKRLGMEPRFVGGMRVTDEETMEIVEMVLVGRINKEIVGLINHHGGKAVGLSGRTASSSGRADGAPHAAGRTLDLGLVGDVTHVNPELIRLLDEHGFIPVIAPVGVGEDGESYNINADLVAGKVAAALQAEKLIHLTDVEGIKGPGGNLISTLSQREARRLVARGVIDGGMMPKVESALRALEPATREGPHHRRPHPARHPAGDLHEGRHRHRDRAVALPRVGSPSRAPSGAPRGGHRATESCRRGRRHLAACRANHRRITAIPGFRHRRAALSRPAVGPWRAPRGYARLPVA